MIKSRVFPGLWLAPTSLITGDMTTVLAVLQQGLNSKEHARVCSGFNLAKLKNNVLKNTNY
ncbi:hypothetical protein [Nostoc sp. DedQUE12b]|uniref:hypothetical protein n=1 Tax=Nostoc sp. DedQUE12b TaxID=3075398 RepID=UPI003A103304